MNRVAVFALFAIAVVSSAPFDPELNEQWENFKADFDKNYNSQEELARRLIWEQKVADINRHNLRADMGLETFRKGINEYSDLRHEEFVRHYLGTSSSSSFQHHLRKSNARKWIEPLNAEIPDTVDWRDKGLVTPVKNQNPCGACWAFSATGSLEGQHKMKTGKLVSLSEQNLIDCSGPQGNAGCTMGRIIYAFEYIKQNNGIDTESSYPFTAKNGPRCLYNQSNVGATLTGYVKLPWGDEEALKKAVATVGPISVEIDAMQASFRDYKDGIYDEPDCTPFLNHSVLVVGYGTEGGKDYWLVKNSWGTSWGIKGYIKMSRNKKSQCGIAKDGIYPLV